MDKKTTGIVAYLTLIGWIIAYLAGDKEGAKFHLNQALVIELVSFIGGFLRYIPLIGGLLVAVVSIFVLVCFILGIVSACKDEEKEVPLLGSIKLLK